MKKIVFYAVVLVLVAGAGTWIIQANGITSNEKQIYALGDSLTHGVGDSSGDGYAENLEELFNEGREDTVDVRNLGIPGQQTDGLLQQIQHSDVKNRLNEADYFTLFIGTNDLIDSNGGDLVKIYEEQIEAGKEEYEDNLQEILDIIREENPDAPILFLGLYNPFPYSEQIEEEVVQWNDRSQRIVDDYSNVKFIPTNDLFPEKSTEYFSDALHPNEKGYNLITEKIIEEYDF
ncbi:GDSL-type esterase/lipase family protein [Halobacillus sp. A1]|uniref:DUF459 domain-containing protein n=1 Tax=Halobacillus sp. A1 TaxID=2880262 RepID=UPI0020A62AEC|nr:GDSL-type esterase/lipase family protein [Halobacillus sp. A1]MCP3029949.1 GDSL-type esterase/lipase family protein [Halobacillus sp. A1]